MKRFNPSDLGASNSAAYVNVSAEGQAYADFIAGEAIVGQHLLYQKNGKVYKENLNTNPNFASLQRSQAYTTIRPSLKLKTNNIYGINDEANYYAASPMGSTGKVTDLLSNGNIVTVGKTTTYKTIISIFNPVTGAIVKEWHESNVATALNHKNLIRAHPNGGFVLTYFNGSDSGYITYDNDGTLLNQKSVYTQTPNNLGVGIHPTNSGQLAVAEPCGSNFHIFFISSSSTSVYRFYKWTVTSAGTFLASNLSNLIALTGSFLSGYNYSLQFAMTRGQIELIVMAKEIAGATVKFYALKEDGTAAISNQGYAPSQQSSWIDYNAVFTPLDNRNFMVAHNYSLYTLTYTLGGAMSMSETHANLFNAASLMSQRHWAPTADGGFVILATAPPSTVDTFIHKFGPTGLYEGTRGSSSIIFGAANKSLNQSSADQGDAPAGSSGLVFITSSNIIFTASIDFTALLPALVLDLNGNFVTTTVMEKTQFSIETHNSTYGNLFNNSVHFVPALDMLVYALGGKINYINFNVSTTPAYIVGVSVEGTNVVENASVKCLTLGISNLTNSLSAPKQLYSAGKHFDIVSNTVKIAKAQKFL